MEEKDLKQLNRSRGGGGGSATYIIWRGRITSNGYNLRSLRRMH